MARKKRTRSRRAKPLLKRFGDEPIATTKREYRKLPVPGKIAVWSVALGMVGGATMVASMNNLPVIGPITGKMAQWGLDQKNRFMS